jgi:SEC-C motif-containing protein
MAALPPSPMPTSSPGPCPCGRGPSFEACCGRYTASATPAPDAESLMRSRYSAFVRGDVPHLLATWHASTRPATLELEPGVKWLGLEVRGHRTSDADHAEVEFVARSRLAGRATRLHERSRFVREDGRWYYVDGDFPQKDQR